MILGTFSYKIFSTQIDLLLFLYLLIALNKRLYTSFKQQHENTCVAFLKTQLSSWIQTLLKDTMTPNRLTQLFCDFIVKNLYLILEAKHVAKINKSKLFSATIVKWFTQVWTMNLFLLRSSKHFLRVFSSRNAGGWTKSRLTLSSAGVCPVQCTGREIQSLVKSLLSRRSANGFGLTAGLSPP